MTRFRSGVLGEHSPRWSAWLDEHIGKKATYTRAEVISVMGSAFEALEESETRARRLAATRLTSILRAQKDDRDADDLPWGTLYDARHLRVVLAEEIASIERQLLDPRSRARGDEWYQKAASARMSKQGELIKVSDWITDEERRLLRDELLDALKASR